MKTNEARLQQDMGAWFLNPAEGIARPRRPANNAKCKHLIVGLDRCRVSREMVDIEMFEASA